MAEENIVTNIVAKSDFSNLIADLNKVTASLTALQDRLQATNKTLAAQAAVMNRGFAETLRSTGQFSTHFVSLSSDVDKFGQQLEKGQIKLRQFFNVYGQHSKTTGGLIRDLARQQVQLQNAILQPLGRNAEGLMQYNVHIPRGLDLVKNKSAIARQELQIMNRVIQEGANSLINWGKNTQWAGRQLTVGLTVPIAAFGKAAADAFRSADQELVRLTKVYGGIAPTTAADLLKVRRDVAATAKELSKSMGAGFNETLGLAADIAATGKTGNELLGSIRETTRLSVLGEVDRQEAMKATLALQSAFKINTENLADSINFLNAVENQTSTTLADLVEAIPKAGPVIEGLGGSVQDLALYLTAMREGGVNAAEGANALKSALASLINPTNVATQKFASFGIDLKAIVTKNAGNLTQTILTLQAALDTLNPLQKQQALEQLFGKFQFARMNALFENLGRQGSQTLQVLDLMKASSTDLANIAGRELSQVTESASGRYRRAIEGLKADLASIGDQFLSINTHLINFVDGIVQFVNKLPKPLKQVLSVFGMLTAAAGPLIMLTGVLGNFFGFIIKGVSHFRSLFKGGEGWKLLTPEILAAQKAGDLVEQTFYSDAQAAAVLKQALAGLSSEYQLLAQRAETAVVATNPTVSTVGGTMIIPGRQVNPQSRFAGEMGTRAATHMNPVAGMSTTQRTAQTLFGVVPGPIPVNRRIGANPQIMSTGDLPEIAGLTRISGVSTGVVASEAAKWHSMMGMLSMLSKREVAQLKKEIMTTGTMSQEFMATYAQLTPLISSVTQNAAQESAAILAQLQAGKLTLDQARAKIIAINAQMETMIAQTVTQTATSLGRTAEITAVPLLNQPVVGPTGKSNIKELFRKGRPVKDIIDRIARILGVRTYGAGYSTETTIPKRMETGGPVYMARAGLMTKHPGSPRGTDTVPAWLTPGEFVVNRKAAAQNLGLLTQINNGNISTGSSYGNGGLARAFATLTQLGIRGRQYRAKAVLENAGIPISTLQNSVYPARHGFANLRSRGGAPVIASSYLSEFSDPNVFKMANAVLIKSNLPPINDTQHKLINEYLTKNINAGSFVTEQEFGRQLTKAYIAAGVSPNQLKALSARNTMRFSFPGTGTITQRRDNLINLLSSKYPEAKFQPDLKNNNNIIVNFPGQPSFKIEHEATRTLSAQGVSYETLRQSNPAGSRGNDKLAYAHLPLDESLFMNQGGMIPGVKYYPNGGPVEAFMQGVKNPYGKSLITGASNMNPMGTGAQIGISMAGTTAGMMLAQSNPMLGNALMIGSNILPMLSMLRGLGGTLGIATKLASVLGKLTIPGAIITTLFLVGKKLLDIKKHAEDVGKANRLAFGGTAESYASVGIKNYKSLTDRVKEMNEQLELAKAKGKSFVESYTKAGPTGITLTLTQLKDAIKNAKDNQQEYVKAFNAKDSKDVITFAASLKAQFVAMGLSASEAANQIYAIIKASDKASLALQAVTSKDFTSVIDQTTALNSMLRNLSKATTGKAFNAEEFAKGVDALSNVLFNMQNKFMEPDKTTGAALSQAQAMQKVMEKINEASNSGAQLSGKQVEELKKQNLVYNAILGKAETLASVSAKILLNSQGFGDVFDFSKMSGQDAVNLASDLNKLSSAFDNIFGTSKEGKAITDRITALNSTVKTQTDLAKKLSKFNEQAADARLKQIQKEIDKIKELADERVKALQDEQDLEDYNTQLKKKQLEYQDALAAGNMSAAQQAKLDLDTLVKQKGLRDAIAAIQDKSKTDQKKLSDEAQAIQDAKDASANAVQNAQAAAAKASESVSSLSGFKSQVEMLQSQYAVAKTAKDVTKMREISETLANVFKEAEKSGGLAKSFALMVQNQYKANAYDTPQMVAAQYLNQTAGAAMKDQVFSTAVDRFVAAVDKFYGSTATAPKEVTKDYGNIASLGNPLSWKDIPNLQNLLKGEGLKTNDLFTYKGKTFKVESTSGIGGITTVKKAIGGYVKHYGPGGGVYGSGTGTSDSIPAMLSNGEYVIRASAVNQVGVPFLNTINKMAGGGLMSPRYNLPSSSLRPLNMIGYRNGGQIRNYNVGGLTMNFENGGEVDGRMIFEQFKNAMREDQFRSGRNMVIGA